VVGDLDGLRAPKYMAEQFMVETRFQNVAKCIHVQAAFGIDDPVQETRWLQEQADRTGYPHGIVAHCDLKSPDVEAALERHMAYPNLRGIRDILQGDRVTDPEDPAWRRGYSLLARYDLVCCYDVILAPQNLGKARALAQAHPDVVLCIDHGGIPRTPDRDFDAWRRGMRDAASAENIICKISGFGEVDHAWTVESVRPWVLACIEAFGIERCVLGTNWPVDRLASSYGDILDAFDQITADFSLAERAALFSKNAERIFRI
jgi:predicted TIM-barrel fold metal-dependent hydrolase